MSQTMTAPQANSATISQKAIELAEQLLTTALAGQTGAERKDAAQLARMMKDESGKEFTFSMVDEVFRSHKPSLVARRWRHLLKQYGVPQYFSFVDRTLMRLGATASYFLPGLVMKAVSEKMRADSARVILPGETAPLRNYLQRRTSSGFRINLNHLGEAVIGEEEAQHRLKIVLSHLADPNVNYISVKISSIFSQINLIAWDQTLTEIKSRLRLLYRAAQAKGKFVNLDMEEYRDLTLTVDAFQQVLDEPEFLQYRAGIVLQAYLPDSFNVQKQLTDWAQQRVTRGGVPIKMRLVKGANLAMETVEAELHGWYPAPYPTKADTDANFRRQMEYGCQPEHAAAVNLGVASHNLFDVALALVLRELNGVQDFVELEMLEGMANHQARAVRDRIGSLLLYAPAVQKEDFLSAMAYLVRRLDENTASDNFLREMFAMRPGSPEWEQQKQRFLKGWQERETVTAESRRRISAVEPAGMKEFENEPDTDWAQAANRDRLNNAVATWKSSPLPPLPDRNEMLTTATAAQPAWEALGNARRAEILNNAAMVMREQRFQTLACLRVSGKKATPDADGEVSEAIDFARYYARHAELPRNVQANALGVVTIVSPWNFPYAIPAGGVFAALMAGNTVILKPAPSTIDTAWLLVQQLWQAGVPKDVLHFYPCDNSIGHELIKDERVKCVVLTGSIETARKFQSWRPSLPLYAETSGKNALIVTGQADRELAIKDLVRSAFGHAGQKCSAASLGILEAEVYDDPMFRRQLRDTVASLPCGQATDPRSIVTPTISAPTEKLRRALTTLEPGEEWLLEPKQLTDDPSLWSPGIKLGVKAGSWFHHTECFGPVLGLMRADSLEQAIEWQNATAYGLTAGIHSLDDEEVTLWKEKVQAGNLYINRPITGAIVQRQPFGGWKQSCIGPGAKAGGPNYVALFRHITDEKASAQPDYAEVWKTHFSQSHDPSQLKCESNEFRYRPAKGVILRLPTEDKQTIERAQLASKITGTPLTISLATQEPDDQFIARLKDLSNKAEFLRTTSSPSPKLLQAANEAGLNWINAPLLATGRIELTRWLREQSVSETLHRYGTLKASDTKKA